VHIHTINSTRTLNLNPPSPPPHRSRLTHQPTHPSPRSYFTSDAVDERITHLIAQSHGKDAGAAAARENLDSLVALNDALEKVLHQTDFTFDGVRISGRDLMCVYSVPTSFTLRF
jgi:hypothetical protein